MKNGKADGMRDASLSTFVRLVFVKSADNANVELTAREDGYWSIWNAIDESEEESGFADPNGFGNLVEWLCDLGNAGGVAESGPDGFLHVRIVVSGITVRSEIFALDDAEYAIELVRSMLGNGCP